MNSMERLREQNALRFDFPDIEDKVALRSKTGAVHVITSVKIGKTNVPVLSPMGIAGRVLHAIIPFNEDMNPNMLPYDARKITLEYYGTMLVNLFDSSYSSFMNLPDFVKSEIDDNFVNLVKVTMLNDYIMLRYFISCTAETDTPVNADVHGRVLNVNAVNIANDKNWLSRHISPLSQDRKYFSMEWNQKRREIFQFKCEKMAEARKTGDKYGRIG